jgi:hypothetical protein
VKSVRLDARIEARLREAARLARVPESRIIRDALARYTDAILANRLDYQMADLIGSIAGGQPTADRAHEAFEALLQQELRQEVRKRHRGARSKSRSS